MNCTIFCHLILIFYFVWKTFFSLDIYPHPRPTTSTHYPRPTTFSYTHPSCPKIVFQSEARWKIVDMKMTFYPNANKTHFHKKSLALILFFKVRVFVTRKGRIFYRLALFNHGHIVMCNKRCALQNQWITLTRLTDTNCFVINIKGCIFASLRLNKRRRSAPVTKSSTFWWWSVTSRFSSSFNGTAEM